MAKPKLYQDIDTINNHLETHDTQLADNLNKIRKISSSSGACMVANSKYAFADKQAFELRNVNEFDANSTNIRVGFNKVYSVATNTTERITKALHAGNCLNCTVQALMYWDSATTGNEYIGFSTQPQGQLITALPQQRYVGLVAGNGFIYNNGTTIQQLVAPGSLSTGWYIVTFTVLSDGSAKVSIASLNSTLNSKTFELIGLPSFNNVCLEVYTTTDLITDLKVLSHASNYINFLPPYIPSRFNFHTPYTFTLNGIKTLLHLPANYNPNVKNKCAIFCHGSGGSALDLWNYANENSLLQVLLDAGYVVIGTDYTSKTCWGNQQSTQDIADMISFYKTYVNIENDFYVIGESMGGLVSLNSIVHGTLPVKAYVGIYPVINLEQMYGAGQFTSLINAAYGISNASEFQTKTDGYDPLNDNNGSIFKNIPFLIWSSYSDTFVDRTQNTDAFATKINALGGSVSVNTSTGEHGNASNFVPLAVINFFNQY